MTSLSNRSKQLLVVTDAGEDKEIQPGATIDVDGRQNWADHLFVKAGWLEVVSEAKGKAKAVKQSKDDQKDGGNAE